MPAAGKRRVTDIAASVRQRLQNVARASDRPFQEVLQYYAMERFLYRLAQSAHAERFVLKGASWHRDRFTAGRIFAGLRLREERDIAGFYP